MPNALTRDIGFKVGPLLLDVLAKHYRKSEGEEEEGVKLRKNEILFDEAFNIVKSFLNTASWHTVEDLQAFSNTRTPSPPWVKVVRTLVPMTSCDQAANYLVEVLGGEEFCRKLIGGIKWWQVRGVNGVDGQWIVARKDWKEAQRRHKRCDPAQSPPRENGTATPQAVEEEATYNEDMDAMRCILFLHGGGYYFGSVDQERYSIQRLARKINGRVFAINYRLAPQYPFPCAIQDALAAYLYLIRPPPGAPHTPVDPAHIVIAGDSAGGGLSLSLLQVIRDAKLPAPAGGILISPWCDLTHSFPSIHTNTATDVIPDCGLSFHKPSTLWPPPSEEVSTRVHASLRHRIRQAFKLDGPSQYEATETIIGDQAIGVSSLHPEMPIEVGSTTSVPSVSSKHSLSNQKICLTTQANETLEIHRQVHFYTENSLIVHPLISSALSYLGDLPPLLFIVGDKEVLRDEDLYASHMAANPSKFPIPERSKALYPPLANIKPENMKPTSVHLQVYDDSPHVLPILFSFTTPAKFCFRAMATFCKFVTNIPVTPPLTAHASFVSTPGENSRKGSTEIVESPSQSASVSRHTSLNPAPDSRKSSLGRRISARFSRVGILRHSSLSAVPLSVEAQNEDVAARDGRRTPQPETSQSQDGAPVPSSSLGSDTTLESDVAGPRFDFATPHLFTPGERSAGERFTYSHIKDSKQWECGMIRERVSTDGLIRPLEPEDELDAMKVSKDVIGRMSELTMRRCINVQQQFDKKFAHTYKLVDKHRRKNIEQAKRDTVRQLTHLRKTIITKDQDPNCRNGSAAGEQGFKEYLLSSPGWSWAWALDEHENPPPTSIVSRRDTEEARKLAEVADLAILGTPRTFSGNNLWSIVVNFFTVTPGQLRIEKTLAPPSDEPKSPTRRIRARLSRMFGADHFHQHRQHTQQEEQATDDSKA
ncbi:hypothetical protein EST38_g897 [Candolleomyces aberdarensis]|uniref:Alpha/beta hydrolase fold-3 domain-containing protein n=1 Tax=Candolleomyces aberdarensis TaxID=2316362 RepID=A0A4Q2DWU3_9AGAR|nr:hypothetical protein EST38_g897 [Candolleomyces aberdarensis]